MPEGEKVVPDRTARVLHAQRLVGGLEEEEEQPGLTVLLALQSLRLTAGPQNTTAISFVAVKVHGSASTPLLKSITTLIPSRLDSSLISLTPSIFFFRDR